jgi:hypothetical protein
LSLLDAQEIDQRVFRQVALFSKLHQPIWTPDMLADILLNGEGTYRCGSIHEQPPGRQVEAVFLTLGLDQAELASDFRK